MTKLKQIQCDPSCGFMVRSHDSNEVVGLARKHAKEKHHMTPKTSELKGMMKTL